MNFRTPDGEPDALDRANIALFAELERKSGPYAVLADQVCEFAPQQPPPGGFCDVYWGSHGCDLERGHMQRDGTPHDCGCCECEHHPYPDWPDTGVLCVAKAPYYGPDTHFYGEDATPETVGRWGSVIDG